MFVVNRARTACRPLPCIATRGAQSAGATWQPDDRALSRSDGQTLIFVDVANNSSSQLLCVWLRRLRHSAMALEGLLAGANPGQFHTFYRVSRGRLGDSTDGRDACAEGESANERWNTLCQVCTCNPPLPLHHHHIVQEVGHAPDDLTVSTKMHLHARKSLHRSSSARASHRRLSGFAWPWLSSETRTRSGAPKRRASDSLAPGGAATRSALRPQFVRLHFAPPPIYLASLLACTQSFQKRPPSLVPVVTDYVRRLVELREAGAGLSRRARDRV